MSSQRPIDQATPPSRRHFLRYAAAMTGGAVMLPSSAWAYAPSSGKPVLLPWMPPKFYPTEYRDVIVVGSGFGGAITACRLAEHGVRVTLIEQGRRWDRPLAPGATRFSKNLYPDGRSTWLCNTTVTPLGPPLPINKTTGVLQGRQLAGKTVLNGAAYGGGSIAYGGILAKPEEEIFKMVFPPEISYQEMQRHYNTVGQILGRGTIPDDVLKAEPFRHVRVARDQSEKAGVEWELIPTATNWGIVRQELAGAIPPSIIHGEAIYGVNSGAKGTLDNTYLKRAEDTGLMEVKTLHQVQAVGQDAAGRYTVSTTEINEAGYITAYRTYACRRLFMSSGTVTTSSLLIKAKAKGTLRNLNEHVGQGWGNNGNVYALRLAVGARTGQWQGGPPAIGMKDLNNPLGPLFIEHPQLPLGIDIGGLLYFGIGINPTRGSFRYDRIKDDVVIDWPAVDEGQKRINQALLNTLGKLNKVNGGITTSLLGNLVSKVKDDICYHPMGGCVIGKATDFFGRVKGQPGLYVNDGSLMPGTSGCVNPAFTIAALAERNIERIIAEDF
jgi:cholesterol oxidase